MMDTATVVSLGIAIPSLIIAFKDYKINKSNADNKSNANFTLRGERKNLFDGIGCIIIGILQHDTEGYKKNNPLFRVISQLNTLEREGQHLLNESDKAAFSKIKNVVHDVLLFDTTNLKDPKVITFKQDYFSFLSEALKDLKILEEKYLSIDKLYPENLNFWRKVSKFFKSK